MRTQSCIKHESEARAVTSCCCGLFVQSHSEMCMFEWIRTLKDLTDTAAEDCEPVGECSDSSDEITEMVIEEPDEKWDCETILCE